MTDPHADAYLVKDVADQGPGTWRWVYDHPVLRFLVPDVPRLKFAMDFAIPERTMRETGPVTLTFSINGKAARSPARASNPANSTTPTTCRANAASQRDQPGGDRSRPRVGIQGRWRQAWVSFFRAPGSRSNRVQPARESSSARCSLAAVSLALGGLLLRDSCRDPGVRFVSGAALLSLLVFVLCAAGLAYPVVFLALGATAIGAVPVRDRAGWGAFEGGLPRPRWLWGIAFGALPGAVSEQCHGAGNQSRTERVSSRAGGRYLREHGFVRIRTVCTRRCPPAWRCCFCWRTRSAATRRRRWCTSRFCSPWHGRFSATRGAADSRWRARRRSLVFTSPVIGIDGTSAYNDVAVAAIAFTLFHLLQLWDEKRDPRYLAAIGLVAGFAFAAKYTAWPALLYAVGFVLVKQRKAVVPVAACAALSGGAVARQELDLPARIRWRRSTIGLFPIRTSWRASKNVSPGARDVSSEIALGDPDAGDGARDRYRACLVRCSCSRLSDCSRCAEGKAATCGLPRSSSA